MKKCNRSYSSFILLFLLIIVLSNTGIGTTVFAAPEVKAEKQDLKQTDGYSSKLSNQLVKPLIPQYLDVLPPTALTSLAAVAFHTANKPAIMELSWSNAQDNVGVTGYILERSTNSDFLNSTVYNLNAVNNYKDDSVHPSTNYYWRIKAKDAAGNISPEWLNFNRATLPAPIVNKQLTIEGDSTSVGYGLSGYVEGPPEIQSPEQWGRKLGDMLDGTWIVRTVATGGDRILGNIRIDRTAQIKAFRRSAFERDIVLLWAGTNDIYGLPYRAIPAIAPLTVYQAIKLYSAATKSDGFEMWLMDAYPRSTFGGPDKNAERITFNNLIRADNTFVDKFIDIDAWAEFKTNLNNNYYQSDQAHLSRDGNQLVAERVYKELVTSPLTFTTASSLPDGKIGTVYSQNIITSGGNGTRTVSLAKGVLPTGLSILNGEINGVPSRSGVSKFTLKVKDNLGTSSNQSFNLKVNTAQ